MNFSVFDLSGNLLRFGTCSDGEVQHQALNGEILVTGSEASSFDVYLDLATNEVVPIPEAPSADHYWDQGTKSWQVSIEPVRARVLDGIKRRRDAKIEGGFTWDGSRFDSDTAKSQPRLLGAFTTAMAGAWPTEGQPWRLQDNSWRVLTAQDTIGVWGALQAHLSSAFATFAIKEAEVLSLTTVEALQAYDVDSDWD